MTIKWLKMLCFTASGLLLLAVLLLGASIPYALLNQPDFDIQGQTANRLVIENVRLANDDSGLAHLLVVDAKIKTISKQPIPFESDELRFNANGLFISPGLIDMHVHIYDRTDLLLNLAFGVTTVRNMHGMPHHLQYREEISAKAMPGPELIISSPILNKRSNYAHGEHHWFLESTEQARSWVRSFHAQGYDLIKVYDGLDAELFNAIVDEAQSIGMPVAGHPPFNVAFENFLNANPQTIEHAEMLFQAPLNYSYEKRPLNDLIKLIADAQIPVDVTLYNFHELALIAQYKTNYLKTLSDDYINPVIKDRLSGTIHWALSIDDHTPWLKKSNYMGEITLALHQAGAALVLGSDAGAGYILNGEGAIREMIRLNAIGIDSGSVFKIATRSGALALGKQDTTGQIAEGFEADLILTKDDPTSNLQTLFNVQSVINNGTLYDNLAIQSMKRQAKNHMSGYELMGWYFVENLQRLLA